MSTLNDLAASDVPATTEVEDFVLEYLNKKFDADPSIALTSTFNELFVDSLGVVQLGMKVKRRFGVAFEAGEIVGTDVVGDVITLINERRSAGA